MKENIGISWRNLRRRKLRSWLTVIGIFISVAIIFILVSLSLGLEEAIEEQFRQLGSDKFFVQPRGQLAGPGTGSAVNLTKEDVKIIERVGGVRDISYWKSQSAKIEYKNQVRFVNVVGIPLDRMDVFLESGFIKPEEGRILGKGDKGKIMIGSQYKHNNFFKEDVKVGDSLKINDEDFRIKGILKTVGNPADDRIIYVGLEELKELFPETGDKVDVVAVQIEQGQDLKEISERVDKRLLNARDVDEETRDFTILTPEEVLNSFGNVLNILTGFLIGVGAISLIVGSIGVANTMYTSVLERTKEIGVMKAVGARNSDVLILFSTEAGLLGLVGGVFGVVLGVVFVKGVEFIAANQLGVGFLRAALPLYLIIGSLVFAFVVGAVSGMWPAWQASRIKPVDALRYE